MTTTEQRKYPATFITSFPHSKYKDGWQHTVLVYEYRGHRYSVEKHNNGYAFDSLWKQHKEEQAHIDEMIAHENDPIPEWKYEGSGQEGFDIFYEIINGEGV